MPLGKSDIHLFLNQMFLRIIKVNSKRTSPVDVMRASMYDGRQIDL